ncbi:Aromatic di-alanine and TPR containing protein [Ceratobasidium theobromae]|uniref:Aromatic di-alanine and TPR containing protein n=1 Tax=Ceratobasidium theobromae TaxID=1582974 RepID=A0A5N5QM03_9AGAM|nr:Aromatic di-alanine and TPR containing protein [Ceratobasidium theobromae]
MPSRPNNLGNAHQGQFTQQPGEPEDIDRVIEGRTHDISLPIGQGHPDTLSWLTNLGNDYFRRFQQLGNLKDIDRAIECRTRVVFLTPEGHPDMPGHLHNLGNAHSSRFERLGKLEDIDKVIECRTRAASLIPEGHPNIPTWLGSLGNSHFHRFERLGELGDINKAIEYGTRAASRTPESHPSMPIRLNNLGSSHLIRFKRLGKLEDINKAIEYGTCAVLSTPEGHPNMPTSLSNLGSSHLIRSERLGKLADIDKAIECWNRAVLLTPEGNPGRPTWLNNLGNAHSSRFQRLGKLEDIDKAIECGARAVLLTPDGHLDMPMCTNSLGSSYSIRFGRLGKLEDIDKAIECGTRATSLTPEDHPDMPIRLNDLGMSYHRRFQQLGKLEDIDNAIEYGIRAVSLTPDDHPEKPVWLTNLGISYHSRFERLGKMEDIDKAIEHGDRAVLLTPKGHPDMSSRLNNLGNSHFRRSQQLGKQEDIDKAIECGARAVRLTPKGHPDMPGQLNNLGNAYSSRFERLGKLEDINKAIECGARAVSLTPKGHPDMPMGLNNLGSAYRSRFEQLGNPEDISKGIECGARSVSLTPGGHPDMPILLDNLGDAHQSHFHSTGNLQALTQALDCYRNSSQVLNGRPLPRFHAARKRVKLAPLHPDSDLLSAHQIVIALVPGVVWLGETIDQRYEIVQTVAEAVLEAAAAAIDAQEYTLALEWLEQGRSIVWNQILQLRNPLDDLSDAHPSLAANLRELAGQLHSASSTPLRLSIPMHKPLSLEEAAQKHRQLAGQYEALLKQIRALPGFEGFLGPKRASELLSAVQTGPLVVINVHKSRCGALIMLPGDPDIKHIPLPDLTAKKVVDARAQLQGTLEQHGLRDRSGSRRPDKSAMERWKSDELAIKQDDPFKQLLMVLWSTTVRPILEFLGYSRLSAGEPFPHITWCATGALSFLPLHAAGNYDQPGENLFSYAISSFTPTISALLPSAFPSAHVTLHSRLLAIGQEATPRRGRLPGTRAELSAIEGCSQPPLECMRIEGAKATRKSVLEAIERHDWIHLACHAHQDVHDPTESGFFLHDGLLSLATITQKSFKNKGLAFLSACQTATGDRKIADEAVHLASGMLMAGYPSVIGTMWSVKDADAPIIAKQVYGQLLKKGKMDYRDAARALHKAVAKLREKVGEGAFERWAPFIHIGI